MRKLAAVFATILFSASAVFAGWQNTQWNSGVKVQQAQGGGFTFLFPVCNAHVNAIQTDRRAWALNKFIVIRYKITKLSGTPKFVSLDPSEGLKPNFRPMIQVSNDDYMGENNRWWPHGVQCAFLADNMDGQEHELRVKLKPNLWTNVYGKSNPSAFKDVLTHNGKLNVVWGGGRSFSHGVCERGGKVRVWIISVKVVTQ